MDMATPFAPTAIILYGRSLLLDKVERKLRANGRLPILRLSKPPTPPLLKNIPAGTIMYDCDCVEETAVYQLSTNYPDWKLVGLTTSAKIDI